MPAKHAIGCPNPIKLLPGNLFVPHVVKHPSPLPSWLKVAQIIEETQQRRVGVYGPTAWKTAKKLVRFQRDLLRSRSNFERHASDPFGRAP